MGFDGQAPFGWRASGEDKLLITYEGKQIMVLRGSEAAKAIRRLEQAEEEQQQLILAKLTGNFKRGNERLAAEKRSER